jgi:phage repressor protein C with HTH and peptisase S24 domain
MSDSPLEPHERLAMARKNAGFADKADFARAVGINATTYRAYENGQNGFAKLAPMFARHLGVSVSWLLGGDEDGTRNQPPLEVIRPAAPEQPIIKGAHSGDGALTVRAVDLSYAMGDGTNIDDYYEEQGVQFDPNWLRNLTRAPVEKLFVAKGDGDSMFPTLLNEDQVLIDTTQKRINQQDRIWACAYHGAGMIKRLRVVGEGMVEIISDNPSVSNREVPAADLEIVGRVIWVGRRL